MVQFERLYQSSLHAKYDVPIWFSSKVLDNFVFVIDTPAGQKLDAQKFHSGDIKISSLYKSIVSK